MRNKTNSVLKLLLLKGNLYPADMVDYETLKERNVPLYRIPLSSLPQLKKSALTQLDVEIGNFNEELWDSFMEKFEADLAKHGTVYPQSAHEVWLKTTEAKSKQIQMYFDTVSKFTQRYCIRTMLSSSSDSNVRERAAETAREEIARLKQIGASAKSIEELTERLKAIDTKPKPEDAVRYRIKFKYSDEINNSYAFINANEVLDTCEVMLTANVKLSFVTRTVNGVPSISVVCRDKHGDVWHDSVSRTGRFQDIPKEQFAALSLYFLNLS